MAEEAGPPPFPAPPVRRRNHGRGHSYYDAIGRKVPGVTALIKQGKPNENLVSWSANATAAYAVDHWDELSEMKPSQRLARLQKARFEDRDAAANRGTAVHALAERLVHGEEVKVPDELAGHVESYVHFLDDFDVAPILVEFVVVSYRYGWAGTGDLVASLTTADDGGREVWGIDLKTSRSGIFGEVAWQLGGYFLGADVVVDSEGNEHAVPEVDRFGAVHIRADGYSLHPIEVGPQQLNELRYIQQVAAASEGANDYVGEPLRPPVRRGAAS